MGNDEHVGAAFTPDWHAHLTWHRCIAPDCTERVDPRDHNHRCPKHRRERADLTRIRQLVESGRRKGAADAYRRQYPDG